MAGFHSNYFQDKTYEGRVFVSLGASWVDGLNSSPNDSMQSTDSFAEKMMGIIKGGTFDSELDEKVGFDASCGVSTFEKGNLLLTCETETLDKAQIIANDALVVLEEILDEYNNSTRENYAFGNVQKFALETTPNDFKMVLALGLAALVLGCLWVTVLAFWRGKIYCVSQVQDIFEKDIPLFSHKTLSNFSESNLYFIGTSDLPKDFKKSNLFLQSFSKFNSEKDFLVVILGKAKVDELKFAKNFSKNLKIIATNFKK